MRNSKCQNFQIKKLQKLKRIPNFRASKHSKDFEFDWMKMGKEFNFRTFKTIQIIKAFQVKA